MAEIDKSLPGEIRTEIKVPAEEITEKVDIGNKPLNLVLPIFKVNLSVSFLNPDSRSSGASSQP